MPGTSFSPRLRFRLFSWPTVAIGLLVTQASLSFTLKQGAVRGAYSEISYFVLLLLAGGVAALNAIQNRHSIRLFWSFLAVAYGLWALVPCLWFYFGVLQGKAPDFLVATFPLFLHIVLMIAAVVSRPHLRLPSHRPYRATWSFLVLLLVWVFAYAYLLFPYRYAPLASFAILRYEGFYFTENLLLLVFLGMLVFRSQLPWKSIYWHLFGASALYALGSLAANIVLAFGDSWRMRRFSSGGWIGMPFTAAICWFVWISLQGRRLAPQLAETIQLDTSDTKYSSVLAMLAVLAIPIVGVWELFRTDEPIGVHEIRLLLVLIACALLAVAVFIHDYLANREFTSDIGVAHDRLRLAMDSGKSVGWEWDIASGRELRFGDQQTMFGIASDTHIGSVEDFLRSVHPEDRDLVAKAIADATQNRHLYAVEFRVVWPNGIVRWVAARGRCYYASNGDPERVLGIAVDITDHKQAEETRQRHSAIVQSCDDAIISMDLQGIIADWNSAAEKIYGYSHEEAVGRKIELIVPPDLRSEEAMLLTRLGAGEFIQHFETVRVRRDGSRVNVSLTISPIRDFAGRIVGASKIARDVSEAKRAQEDLQASYAEIRQLKEKLQAESDYLQEEVRGIGRYEDIIGSSEVLSQVLKKVEQVASTDSVVLITGESGTGKELIARAIHNRSKRKDRVMVKVDCAALPATLVESELFGREKGAYTGALTRQIGRFETADDSTIFLDEIGELGLEMQAKLLRIVQDGDFERLGSPKTTHVNVRLIAATHRDLAERVKNGTFREDLFYRLNVFPIHVPPLRERLEDIPLLVTAFLREFEKKMGKKICRVPSRMMDELRHYPWPGNIRELRNVIERAVIITTGEKLNLQLPTTSNVASIGTLKEAEYKQIVSALNKSDWRIKGPGGAAAILGMNPSTLYSMMRRLHIYTRHEKGGTQS